METKSRWEAALREVALGYPEANEEFPWGDRVVKVRGKIFVFLSGTDGGLGISVKLPASHEAALLLPFAAPTGYGLGRSGWVSARFGAGDEPPLPLLRAWIDESYRAVAPKRLIAQLDGGASAAKAAPLASPARTPSKRTTAAAAPARKAAPAAPARKKRS